jgi:hypothetical protein
MLKTAASLLSSIIAGDFSSGSLEAVEFIELELFWDKSTTRTSSSCGGYDFICTFSSSKDEDGVVNASPDAVASRLWDGSTKGN